MKNNVKTKKGFEHWKIIAAGLMIFDVFAMILAYFLGLWLRFDFIIANIPAEILHAYTAFIGWYIVAAVAFFWFARMYRGIWRFISFREMVNYVTISLIAAVVHCVAITVLFARMPISYYVVGSGVQIVLLVGIRCSYRFYNEILRRRAGSENVPQERVMIIGAGAAGKTVIRELLSTDKISVRPCCIIDDNKNKWGRYIEGVPVVGGREFIPAAVEKYAISQIYLCIPATSSAVRRDILEICKETGCQMKTLPGIYQLASSDVLVSRLKSVEMEDLLGRDPIRVNMDEIYQQIKGKTILVTGGGGSIGGELCRQVAAHDPKLLIIFDIYENTTYGIELELREKHPSLNLKVLIGSVRDSRRINQVFETYKPDIVYHAAAHKHVPLMEYSPNEAIKNNVIGTYKTAYAAMRHGTSRFILVSTDKAVNPTNIMGASKRLCEMVVQSLDVVSRYGQGGALRLPLMHDAEGDDPSILGALDLTGDAPHGERTGTQFVAVRFGNVLGSNGSVLHRFKRQIEIGGPLTVTHREITRFFMTIPEAVSLVMQAGTYAKGGEIFVLDMGEPVKIDTLARNLISLSGFKPDEDIKIVYTGLRPGEKLYEEKLMAEEGIQKTENSLIYIGKPIAFDIPSFLRDLDVLAKACYDNSPDIVPIVEGMVSTFHPVGEHPDRA